MARYDGQFLWFDPANSVGSTHDSLAMQKTIVAKLFEHSNMAPGFYFAAIDRLSNYRLTPFPGTRLSELKDSFN